MSKIILIYEAKIYSWLFYLHISKLSGILQETKEVNMSDVVALVLGVLVVLLIPAVYLTKKAKAAQEKEHIKEIAQSRNHRNKRRIKKK